MKQFFKDYLSFNKRERNGIFVLLLILTIVIAVPRVIRLFSKKENVDVSSFQNDISKFEKYIINNNYTSNEQQLKNKNNNNKKKQTKVIIIIIITMHNS